MMRQTFHIDQKMRKKSPHLLIAMSSQGVVGESLNEKLVKNRIKLGDSESVTPTHIDAYAYRRRI